MSFANIRPDTGGGCSIARNISLGTTGANVKATPGNLYGFVFTNNGAAVAYVKLYDEVAAPTVGTDTPVMTILVPIKGTVPLALPQGISFLNGIGWGATTGPTDADTGAPAANQVIGTLFYF